MPKISFWHFEEDITAEQLTALGHEVRALVAEALSSEDEMMGVELVDWVPQRYIDGTIVEVSCSIELDTIGWEKRKKALTKELVSALKAKILTLPEFQACYDWPPDTALVWTRLYDGASVHV